MRNDYLHKLSTYISKNHAAVVLEALKIKIMSASAKGTVEEPGRKVRQKADLNKAILDQGWGNFHLYLEYKQDRLGGMVIYVTQTTPARPAVTVTRPPGQPKKPGRVCLPGLRTNSQRQT